MITIDPNFDLELLTEHFTECGDYTKEVILEELLACQKQPDFLIILSINDTMVDGFLIGYRNRNSLWVAQVWRRNDGNFSIARDALVMAKAWAKERGMTSISGETKRNEIAAMKRYGFNEFSINMRLSL